MINEMVGMIGIIGNRMENMNERSVVAVFAVVVRPEQLLDLLGVESAHASIIHFGRIGFLLH
jgi:hypothetical protein